METPRVREDRRTGGDKDHSQDHEHAAGDGEKPRGFVGSSRRGVRARVSRPWDRVSCRVAGLMHHRCVPICRVVAKPARVGTIVVWGAAGHIELRTQLRVAALQPRTPLDVGGSERCGNGSANSEQAVGVGVGSDRRAGRQLELAEDV